MFISIATFTQPSKAADFSCLNPPDTIGKSPIWSTSSSKDLKFVVAWAFKDPENCIVGMQNPGELFSDNHFRWNYPTLIGKDFEFPAVWKVSRAGEMALVSAETEFPVNLLKSLPNRNLNGYGFDLLQNTQEYDVSTAVKIRKGSSYGLSFISGQYGLAQLWGNWFSKNQEIFPSQCEPIAPGYDLKNLNSNISWKILEPGPKAKIEISIEEKSNCIFLVHTGPLTKPLGLTKFTANKKKTLAERPFWSGEAPAYFDEILTKPNQLIQVAVGEFTGSSTFSYDDEDTDEVKQIPEIVLEHSDSVQRSGSVVKVTSTIDGSQLSSNPTGIITIYAGFYWWYTKDGTYSSAGWRISYSGSSWTARYSPATSLPGGIFMGYTARAIKIPTADLFTSSEKKAAAELKAKQEAEVKAAAELKAKQEAEAKAAAELKAKQEADAKAAAELKIKQEAEAKAAAEKAAADAKAAADKAAADAAAAIARQDAKKLTISCIKGKVTKNVTGENPKCPKGYKNPLDAFLTFKAFSSCQLYKKDLSFGGVALNDGGKTLTFSSVGKYSYSASAPTYSDIQCALGILKAPSFVKTQIDTTRALDGVQKASWGKVSAFWTYHPSNGVNISFNTK